MHVCASMYACMFVCMHVCILLEYNNFAETRKDIFGRRGVVESFLLHPTPILLLIQLY